MYLIQRRLAEHFQQEDSVSIRHIPISSARKQDKEAGFHRMAPDVNLGRDREKLDRLKKYPPVF